MFNSLPTPVLIAHRGASAHAPENTLEAFKLAVSQGADALELDVQLTSDGIPVVFHDSTLSRTTNGTGILRQQTLENLKLLDAGNAFGSAYEGVRIPTLEEIFNEIDEDIFLNIELKNLGRPFDHLAEKVASLVKKYKFGKRVLFSSFNPISLSRARKFLPEVPRGLLLHSPIQIDLCLLFPALIASYQSLHISFSSVTRERVYAIHNLGKKVFSYTLNHTDDIAFALSCGVDGLFTDDPALVYRYLNNTE